MIRLLLSIAVLVLAAAPAAAATRYQVIDDCSDDSRLQGRYTLAELRDARHNLRTEVAEYTDCEDVLRRAELALTERSGGGGAAATTGGSGEPPASSPPAPASEAERTALQEARTTGDAPVAVRGREIEPGSAGFTAGAVRNDVPGSLLPVILGLALLCTWASVAALRGFVSRGTGEAMGNDIWRPIP